MVTDDDKRRGQLIIAVRAEMQAESARLIRELEAALATIFAKNELPQHRVSGLVRSLAWHASRPTPELRVRALVDELKRLAGNTAEDAPASKLYPLLLTYVGRTEAPATWEAVVMKQLRPRPLDAERETWLWAARLAYASMLVQIFETLVRSRALRADIELYGGAVRWQ